MSAQLGLDLAGGEGVLPTTPLRPSIAFDDPMPPGPYSIGLTHWWAADGIAHQTRPYTILCGDGRCIAGHVESKACAEAIVEALNRGQPS